MANEVVIYEYAGAGINRAGGIVPVYNVDNLITTQFLNIGTESAAFNANTKYVVLSAKGTAYQFKFGQSGVTATANADGVQYIPASGILDFSVDVVTNLNTVADA